MTKKMTIKQQLEEIRREIDAERVSMGEVMFLRAHWREIYQMGDIVLAQWADIPEWRWQKYGC